MSKKKASELYGIIGLGRFGFSFAKTLAEAGKEIIVIDNNEQKIREATAFTDNAFTVGALTKENLEEVGIKNCDVVAVCIGSAIDTSILTTLVVLQLGVKRVISKAISREQGCVLEKLGAEVVYPERDMAVRTANKLISPHVLDYISLSEDVDIMEVGLTSVINGVTVDDLDIRQKFGLNIIAVKRNKELVYEIKPELALKNTDSLIVIGKRENLEQFEAYMEA